MAVGPIDRAVLTEGVHEGGKPPRDLMRLGSLCLAAVLIGLSLRPFIAVVAPLAPRISLELGMSAHGVSSITFLPFIMMGLVAPVAEWVKCTVGERSVLLTSMMAIVAGNALRLFVPDATALVMTALVAGVGVAFVQALVPGMLKREMSHHVVLASSLYSAMLMGGGGLGAQIGPIIADHGSNWRAALAWMALPALAGLVVAWFALPRVRRVDGVPFIDLGALGSSRLVPLMVVFGLTNAGYTSIIAWLPVNYQLLGWTPADSGSLIANVAAGQVLGALSPVFMSKRHALRGLLCCLGLVATGFGLLTLNPLLVPQVTAVTIGIGLGGCFAWLIIFALSERDDGATVRSGSLVALMQGGGFLLAAFAPWVTASLYDLTGDFQVAWLVQLTVLLLALLFVALRFERA